MYAVGCSRHAWLAGLRKRLAARTPLRVPCNVQWPEPTRINPSLTAFLCTPLARVQIVLHPRWGSAVYPASLFAKAPLEAVQRAIQETEEELKAQGLDKL